ncbi:MAG: DUF4160 domain-containing protein [Candidatus Limnocylindria bacterium]
MPEISRFLGIRIYMYYEEHSPPHFHAKYAGQVAVIDIGSLAVLRGDLPGRALGLVVEWARLHREELETNWTRARQSEPLLPVEPLG